MNLNIKNNHFRRLVEIFANNWSSVVFTNALFTLFCLPFAAWIIICQCYSSLLLRFDSAPDSWYIVTFLGLLPVTLVLFIGLAGSVWAHKRIFWEENGAVAQMFGEGIRKNGFRYLLYGFLCWLSLSTAVVPTAFYVNHIANPLLCGAATAVSILQALIILPAMLLNMAQNVFYEDRLKYVFGNSFKILLLRTRFVLYAAVALLPVAVTVVLPFIWQLSAWILFMMAVVTLSTVFFLSKSKNIFDRITQKRQDNISERQENIHE